MYLLFLVALGVQASSTIPENAGVLVAGRTYRVCQQGWCWEGSGWRLSNH